MTALPDTLSVLARAQVDGLLADVARDVDVLVVGVDEAEVPAAVRASASGLRTATVDAFLSGEPHAAVVILLGAVPASRARDAAGQLEVRARAGASVVAVLDPVPGRLIAPLISGATTLGLHTVQASWLAEPGALPDAIPLTFPSGVPRRAVTKLVILAGAVAGNGGGGVGAQVAAGVVESERVATLAAANVALRRANARLSATCGSREGAAAAALQGRAATLQALLDREIADRAQERAAAEARLAVEVRVAARNDEMFQEVRALLEERERALAILHGLRRISYPARVRARLGRLPLLGALLRRR